MGFAGQGLFQEWMGATAYAPGSVITGNGDTALAAQGVPGFVKGKRPGHMAQPKAQIGVDAEDQQGGHDPVSLTFLAREGEER
jgi:hypothetical protein